MKTELRSIFQRYPQLWTMKGLVPEEVVEQEIGRTADDFECWLAEAKTRIPLAKLIDVFPNELERGSIRLENFLGHWGNVSVEELCKICLIVKWLKPKSVLEIGTYNGMTTLQMALNAPSDATVYTLDLPDEIQSELQLSLIDEYVAKVFRGRYGTSRGSYFQDRTDLNIVQLLGNSATFDYRSAITGKLDLIFIDAAHDFRNKQIDSENALQMLAEGGVILWHNYADVVCPEVTKYLSDLSRRIPIHHLRGTSLAVHYSGWRARQDSDR